ncbi:hypothetical protein GMES_3735 [Paraglaciecola mesophila KMM 241]|uniref:Uncharacterized protein n=1 Tax=Paraglaciecola mesophila KMM 241 TaxID=1128912 RepID=K6Z6J5_9ALTE|nr:hypothetical protein GMES_3735 [Paraglaciecola mesophila KMM 241]
MSVGAKSTFRLFTAPIWRSKIVQKIHRLNQIEPRMMSLTDKD